jgi:pyruvate dehydrogenase E2 component (dihydrolipoamide acetyltransferase)
MPKLGADMTAGKLVAWRVKPDDVVSRGDIVAEVETDKGVIEVEIFTNGVIDQLLVPPGTVVPVGTALARLRESVGSESPTERIPVPSPRVPAEAPAPSPMPPTPPAVPPRLRASPAARELAQTLGIDLGTVTGTGAGGAITREDVQRASVTAATGPPITRADRMRQAIAAAMTRSKREIPHYYLSATIDLHTAITWLAERNGKRSVAERVLPGVMLLKAVARSLREVPQFNALWVGDRAVPSEAIHLGVAIHLRDGGLVAPAIHHTDQLSLDELMQKLADLVSRARSGSLRSSELADPTLTVTSLGDQGAETVFGVIYPPQVAIVGFGRIVERPWVVNGQVLPRSVVTATLSADHRVTHGHDGGRFLATIDRLLQEPDKL